MVKEIPLPFLTKYSLKPKCQECVGIYDIEFVYVRDIQIHK